LPGHFIRDDRNHTTLVPIRREVSKSITVLCSRKVNDDKERSMYRRPKEIGKRRNYPLIGSLTKSRSAKKALVCTGKKGIFWDNVKPKPNKSWTWVN